MTKFSTQSPDGKKPEETPVVVTIDALQPEKPSPRQSPTNRRAQQKKHTCLRCMIVIALLCLLAAGILTTIYVYRGSLFKKGGSKRFECSVPVPTADGSKKSFLKEDVDVSDNDVETINVPKFDENDQATFVHDFGREISVIKDYTDHLCYVMPLNKKLIPRPTNFYEFVLQLQSGKYLLDANKIQSGYEVVHPALTQSQVEKEYGSYISHICSNYQTYKLSEVSKELTTTTLRTTFLVQRRFIMYPGGRVVLQYIIYR